MRMSQLFGETLRTAPADAEATGLRLLLRAGFIRQMGPGAYSYLPLGLRALRAIEGTVREELEAIGGQEIAMPLVQPAELTQKSGLWYSAGEEMARFVDRAQRHMVLTGSHEESAARLTWSDITSYRQLPVTLFQIGPAFRDEPRPGGGLLRAREFTLMDSYAFGRDAESLEEAYRRHLEAFGRVFQRVGLENVILTQSAGGEHEFALISEAGDDAVVVCASCGYAANLRAARFARSEPPSESPLPLEKVATPGAETIESLAAFMGVPASRTAKVVFFTAHVPDPANSGSSDREVLVMALVRGDMDVSETKLRTACGALALRPASAAAIAASGAAAGYASPIGLDSEDALVVVDELVATSPNLISGANQEGYHYRNVNFGRDFSADLVADIAHAFEDAACPDCTAPLQLVTAIEVASLHRFTLAYAQRLGATFQDEDGDSKPLHMGSFGIGVSRLLGCIAEACHDDAGLVLPPSVAPYQVHLVAVTGRDADVRVQSDALYDSLRESGLDVLYDDRDVRAGVKFNDADLIGIPVRLTLGRHSLEQGGVELKRRAGEDRQIVAMADVTTQVRAALANV